MNRWKTNKIEKQHQRPIYCFSIHEHIPVYSSHFYCSSQCSQQKVWVPFTNKVCLWIAGLFDPDTGIYKVGSMCGPQLSTKRSHTHTRMHAYKLTYSHTRTHTPRQLIYSAATEAPSQSLVAQSTGCCQVSKREDLKYERQRHHFTSSSTLIMICSHMLLLSYSAYQVVHSFFIIIPVLVTIQFF